MEFKTVACFLVDGAMLVESEGFCDELLLAIFPKFIFVNETDDLPGAVGILLALDAGLLHLNKCLDFATALAALFRMKIGISGKKSIRVLDPVGSSGVKARKSLDFRAP